MFCYLDVAAAACARIDSLNMMFVGVLCGDRPQNDGIKPPPAVAAGDTFVFISRYLDIYPLQFLIDSVGIYIVYNRCELE